MARYIDSNIETTEIIESKLFYITEFVASCEIVPKVQLYLKSTVDIHLQQIIENEINSNIYYKILDRVESEIEGLL